MCLNVTHTTQGSDSKKVVTERLTTEQTIELPLSDKRYLRRVFGQAFAKCSRSKNSSRLCAMSARRCKEAGEEKDHATRDRAP
jgi:hypothetical protein